MQNVRRRVAVAFLSVVGCVPRETSVMLVEIPPPAGPDLVAEARIIDSAGASPSGSYTPLGAGDAPRVNVSAPRTSSTFAVAPAPFSTSTSTTVSPSLLDPMDSCLPQAAMAGKSSGSAPIDRKALADELRWAKTRAEKCCPRYPGSARVVVTVGPNGAPSNVGVALPGVASANLGTCIRKLFDDVRVTPFVGAPVVETSLVSTENAPPPSTM